MSPIKLTPGQQRHVFATLLSYEKALRLAEQLLMNESETGILYVRKSVLSSAQRRLAADRIADLLDDLAEFVGELGLPATEELSERTIASYLGESWTGLEDCRSKSLANYGRLTAQDAQRIDQSIGHMAQSALELSQLFTISPGDSIE